MLKRAVFAIVLVAVCCLTPVPAYASQGPLKCWRLIRFAMIGCWRLPVPCSPCDYLPAPWCSESVR